MISVPENLSINQLEKAAETLREKIINEYGNHMNVELIVFKTGPWGARKNDANKSDPKYSHIIIHLKTGKHDYMKLKIETGSNKNIYPWMVIKNTILWKLDIRCNANYVDKKLLKKIA